MLPGLIRIAVLSFVAGLVSGGVSEAAAATGLPDREADPVVITGAGTPRLVGISPGDVVAFRWDGAWAQVPVQVDERKWADYRAIRRQSVNGIQFGSEVYADGSTWTEADGVAQRFWNGDARGQEIPGTAGDPTLDSDDEIAMMAKDSGTSAAGRPAPAGVDGSSRTVVKIGDPINPASAGYIYLFRTTSGLDPDAGEDYVRYDWQFSPALSPPYKTVPDPSPDPFVSGYDFNGINDQPVYPPANPEASSVTTDSYEQTFPGRWLVEGLKIKAGNSTAVDILDGDKSTVGQSSCGRNELTFAHGSGGFVASIDGPVRAIRSYIGANSGTYTQRDQIYYEDRADVNTYLRVHAGITDFIMAMDYSEAAFGMTYRNNLNESGVTIDGAPDAVTPGRLTWEQATGAQGSVTNVGRIVTDVPSQPFTSYYLDQMAPPGDNDSMLCSGDTHAIGASGPRIRFIGAGENSDPTLPPTTDAGVRHFTGRRSSFYGPPGEPVETARLRADQVDSPLTAATGASRSSFRAAVARPKHAVKPGHVVKIRFTLRNTGEEAVDGVRVCPVAGGRRARTFGCKALSRLQVGVPAVRMMPVRIKRGAGRKPVRVRFQYRAGGRLLGSEGTRIQVARQGR